MADTKDLIFDDLNFNKGTFEGNVLMEKSLSELKAGRSILIDKDNRIIAGNKTAEVADKLGMKVRIVEVSGDELVAVKRTDIDLDSKEGRELALADNSTTHVNLAWDQQNLEAVMATYEDFDPAKYGVDLKLNAPSATSKGEIDIDTFDTNQTLTFKLTPIQYEQVVNRLKQISTDLSEALLSILGYYE